jgi:hypothetical protein
MIISTRAAIAPLCSGGAGIDACAVARACNSLSRQICACSDQSTGSIGPAGFDGRAAENRGDDGVTVIAGRRAVGVLRVIVPEEVQDLALVAVLADSIARLGLDWD